MSQQDSQKVPVTFHDVAAYFFEDDWKLLQKCQKELYKDAIKEIHQAVISLGFEIVNPDILLRIKKRKTACILDADSKDGLFDHTSSCHLGAQPDVLFRIKKEELYCTNLFASEETEIRNSPSKGFPFIKNDVGLRKDEESCESLMVYHGTEEDDESSRSSSENEIGDSIVSFIIKEEGETYYIDHQNAERSDISSSTDDGIKYTNTINECSVNYGERAGICTASSGNVAAGVIQITNKEASPEFQMWSECQQKLEGEEVIKAEDFCNLTRYNLLHGNANVQRSDEHHEREARIGNSKLLACQTTTQKKRTRPYPCSDCEKSFSLKGDLTVHRRKHTGDTPYKCGECGKRFIRKQLLIRHQRTHSGERPFQCPECDQSFSWHEHLFRHQKIHTGDKPFQCTECEKSFGRKEHLIRHTQTHSGMRPYRCGECDKSFSQKQNLLAHMITHTGDRPFQCTKCEKSFRWKVSLVGHQKIHKEWTEDSNRRCNQRPATSRVKTLK